MRTREYTIITLLILLLSCATIHKLEFYGKTITVDYPKQVDTLKGYSVTLEGEYTGDMYAYDGILVFESEKHPDGYLYLYDVQTGKRVSAIAQRGNGPNEFVNLSFSGDFEKDSNEIYLWINDFQRPSIVQLNTKGERVKEISKSKFKSTNSYGLGHFRIFNDSLLLAHVSPVRIFENENRYSAPEKHVFNYKLGETIKKYVAYSEHEEREDVKGLIPGLYLSGIDGIKPDKTKLATAIFNLKRVDILDLESGQTKSLVTKGAPDLNYLLSGKPVKNYYKALKCDDHYIYVLEYVQESSPGTVYVFDWEGNFVRILRIDEGDIWLAFDPIRKILYTKNDAEEVMAYDVNYLYE